MLHNTVKGNIKSFTKLGSNMFELTVERDKAYELNAKISIPLNYPDCPPSFSLTMKK